VGDIAGEVRAMLGTNDLSRATANHIHRAIYDYLLPGDKAFLEDMATARAQGKRRKAVLIPVEPPVTPASTRLLSRVEAPGAPSRLGDNPTESCVAGLNFSTAINLCPK
jgi:hypothetical protein